MRKKRKENKLLKGTVNELNKEVQRKDSQISELLVEISGIKEI